MPRLASRFSISDRCRKFQNTENTQREHRKGAKKDSRERLLTTPGNAERQAIDQSAQTRSAKHRVQPSNSSGRDVRRNLHCDLQPFPISSTRIAPRLFPNSVGLSNSVTRLRRSYVARKSPSFVSFRHVRRNTFPCTYRELTSYRPLFSKRPDTFKLLCVWRFPYGIFGSALFWGKRRDCVNCDLLPAELYSRREYKTMVSP